MNHKPVRILGRRFLVFGHGDDPYFQRLEAHAAALRPFHGIACSVLRADDVAIDIGANLGLTALALARVARRVFCFEPSPRAYEPLSATIQANGLRDRVIAFPLALSDQVGVARFHTSANSAGSHIVGTGHVSASQTPSTEVATTTLDELMQDPDIAVAHFLKLDAEGSEPRILAGGHRFFQERHRTLFLEFNAWCLLAHQRLDPFEVLRDLQQAFDVSLVSRRRLRLGRRSFTLPGYSLEPIPRDNPYAFMHGHILERGCVDDLLLTAR